MAKAEKLGFKTNFKVKHPFLGTYLDVWIANYVLMDYGTGVVMGCWRLFFGNVCAVIGTRERF